MSASRKSLCALPWTPFLFQTTDSPTSRVGDSGTNLSPLSPVVFTMPSRHSAHPMPSSTIRDALYRRLYVATTSSLVTLFPSHPEISFIARDCCDTMTGTSSRSPGRMPSRSARGWSLLTISPHLTPTGNPMKSYLPLSAGSTSTPKSMSPLSRRPVTSSVLPL